jgi:hypothetical protein
MNEGGLQHCFSTGHYLSQVRASRKGGAGVAEMSCENSDLPASFPTAPPPIFISEFHVNHGVSILKGTIEPSQRWKKWGALGGGVVIAVMIVL